MNDFMEKEKHREYVREIPGSDTVVLFIHGILGTPDHFKKLVSVVPLEWSVYNILLAGHGGTVEDFLLFQNPSVIQRSRRFFC